MQITEEKIISAIAKAINENAGLVSQLSRAIAKGDEIFSELNGNKNLMHMFFSDQDITEKIKLAFQKNDQLKNAFLDTYAKYIQNTKKGIQINEEMVNRILEETINESFLPLTGLALKMGKKAFNGASNLANGIQGMMNYKTGNWKEDYKQGQEDAKNNDLLNGTWKTKGIKKVYFENETENASVMQEIIKNVINSMYSIHQETLELIKQCISGGAQPQPQPQQPAPQHP